MSGISAPLHRHSLRLKGYDYSQNGAYFITACAKGKMPYFEMYPELKAMAEVEWSLLGERFSTLIRDAFVVMPNHVHAVVALDGGQNNNVGATLAVAQRAGASPAPTVGTIVGTYKSLCENRWLNHLKQRGSNAPGKIWQRNYYEHVIRTEEELNLVREYVAFNPLRWHFDGDNPNHSCDQEYLQNWGWLESGRRAGASPAPTCGSTAHGRDSKQ